MKRSNSIPYDEWCVKIKGFGKQKQLNINVVHCAYDYSNTKIPKSKFVQYFSLFPYSFFLKQTLNIRWYPKVPNE